MTNLTRAEIADKCAAALIVSRDEHAIANRVNIGRVKTVVVNISDIQAYLQTNNIWLPLKAAAADAGNAAHIPALALLEAATARFEHIDTTLPFVGTVLGALVTAGIMTAANQAAIIAMGTVPDLVTAYDVQRVLEGV